MKQPLVPGGTYLIIASEDLQKESKAWRFDSKLRADSGNSTSRDDTETHVASAPVGAKRKGGGTNPAPRTWLRTFGTRNRTADRAESSALRKCPCWLVPAGSR